MHNIYHHTSRLEGKNNVRLQTAWKQILFPSNAWIVVNMCLKLQQLLVGWMEDHLCTAVVMAPQLGWFMHSTTPRRGRPSTYHCLVETISTKYLPEGPGSALMDGRRSPPDQPILVGAGWAWCRLIHQTTRGFVALHRSVSQKARVPHRLCMFSDLVGPQKWYLRCNLRLLAGVACTGSRCQFRTRSLLKFELGTGNKLHLMSIPTSTSTEASLVNYLVKICSAPFEQLDYANWTLPCNY